ncbi:Aste57867_9563 [Aphanomyces stellatus]|uniref:Aste57867_9563 protein n=1 Tax=Aphanomyces stellatus TaxID=120398 RepID=A0A485KNK7_9STRA|nr:hypothetical protein As57867_009525 [Aphanomyces stellatus]VFT86442.1 Aste57867_9563 [Aphanomyces stellatus]
MSAADAWVAQRARQNDKPFFQSSLSGNQEEDEVVGPVVPKCASDVDQLVKRIHADSGHTYLLSEDYYLYKDEMVARSIFTAYRQKGRQEMVVKLTNEHELHFIEYLNDRADKHTSLFVADWKTFGVATFNASIGSCPFIVYERGTANLKTMHDRRLNPFQMYAMVIDLVDAVKFLHRHGVLHGNLCLTNALFCGHSSKTKLIDFAMTAKLNLPIRTYGKPEYCPPEVAVAIVAGRSIDATPAMDAWALAVTLLKLFSRRTDTLVELANLDGPRIVRKLASPSFSFRESIDTCLHLHQPQKDVLRKCLAWDPAARGSLDDLRHLVPVAKTGQASLDAISDKLTGLQITMWQLDKFLVPSMWTLREKTGRGILPKARKMLLKTDFAIEFCCEMRHDDHPCDMSSYRSAADDTLVVAVNSPLVEKALPYMKVTLKLFKLASVVAGAGGLVGDFLNFDLTTMDRIHAAIGAAQSINDNVGSLGLEDKLADAVARLEQNASPDEMERVKREVQDAVTQFRQDEKMYETLKQLLVDAGYAFNHRGHIGGLTKKLVRADHKYFPGQVRWVCAHHADAFQTSFVQ